MIIYSESSHTVGPLVGVPMLLVYIYEIMP